MIRIYRAGRPIGTVKCKGERLTLHPVYVNSTYKGAACSKCIGQHIALLRELAPSVGIEDLRDGLPLRSTDYLRRAGV